MSVHKLHADLISTLLREARGRPHITLQWQPARLATLRTRVDAQNVADFERACARGQLAAAEDDLDQAERILLSTLQQFRDLYPAVGHFFSCVVQLALAMQALDLVARQLNDRFETPDLFLVTFHQTTNNPATNLVSVDEAGRCHFRIDPRIPGAEQADYFVGHWLSSAPLWASYCRGAERESGEVLMQSGECAEAPGLAYCGNRPEHILIPDGYFLNSHGYEELRARYDAARASWASRQPAAFWRGSTTGIRTGEKGWESLPRIRLCQLALKNPKVLDAGISNVVQTWHESDRGQIEAAGLVRGPVPEEEFLKFKYQIDIDGNSNSWPGLYQRLLTGSPVLKVASPHGYRQWYYDRLQPWTNFVPVESDMSDLLEKIEWLRAHDDEAQGIGQAGLALARSLEYEQELASAHRQIRTGFRRTAGKSELMG
jgi:Glycosyl transferase family 90